MLECLDQPSIIEKERNMSKKGGGDKRTESGQMVGLSEELGSIFGELPEKDIRVRFEYVAKSSMSQLIMISSRCVYRNNCIGRIMLNQVTGNVCAGPGFCALFVKFSDEAVSVE